MKFTHRFWRYLLMPLSLAGMLSIGSAAELNPAAVKGNHFSRPHFHPNDRYIVVLQGTWWVGTGPHFDPAETKPMPAGSFVTHFGKQVHWDGAKDEDVVLLIQGEGPATATSVKEE